MDMRQEMRQQERHGAGSVVRERIGTARVGGARRRATGPRPIRPVPAVVSVRPAQPPRPVCGATPIGGRPVDGASLRLVARQRVAPAPALVAGRGARLLAGLALFLAVAAVVVVLGLVAGAVGQARGGGAPLGPAVVTVDMPVDAGAGTAP